MVWLFRFPARTIGDDLVTAPETLKVAEIWSSA